MVSKLSCLLVLESKGFPNFHFWKFPRTMKTHETALAWWNNWNDRELKRKARTVELKWTWDGWFHVEFQGNWKRFCRASIHPLLRCFLMWPYELWPLESRTYEGCCLEGNTRVEMLREETEHNFAGRVRWDAEWSWVQLLTGRETFESHEDRLRSRWVCQFPVDFEGFWRVWGSIPGCRFFQSQFHAEEFDWLRGWTSVAPSIGRSFPCVSFLLSPFEPN